ncbi:hypothetical protein CTI12_AA224620 [Artemisia annua]|uniref:Uncharacterized protein n=1 Tax=Artemisia annua TaxID=35608 RepID=A0A2U1NVD1_ARTAN|nr:hypothetical protein CTI12_AA224620 [Artemisia annua]
MLCAYDAPKRLESLRARLGTAWERKRERNVPETFLRRIPSRFWIPRQTEADLNRFVLYWNKKKKNEEADLKMEDEA